MTHISAMLDRFLDIHGNHFFPESLQGSDAIKTAPTFSETVNTICHANAP